MGSIYLRKDGRYEGCCKNVKGDKTLYFYGKSYDEVNEKMCRFWEGQSYGQNNLTIKMLFEEWMDVIKFPISFSAESVNIPIAYHLCKSNLFTKEVSIVSTLEMKKRKSPSHFI